MHKNICSIARLTDEHSIYYPAIAYNNQSTPKQVPDFNEEKEGNGRK
ncbi:hypothetical protein ACTHGU_07210 [Chitinophagaceae bacterium MMS25-I14]